MLQGIRSILKTMGEALTFADAGEMLSDQRKVEILQQISKPARVVLVSDQNISPEVLESTILFCREHNAILDLLCVLPQSNAKKIYLGPVFSRLEAETDLDFHISRKHGDLLTVTQTYTRSRKDTLMILINVSDQLRRLYAGKWSQSFRHAAIKLITNTNKIDIGHSKLHA